MMTIIEEELASPKIIIDQTVKEIEQMEEPKSDWEFIDYVDSLEKIERDLLILDQLDEISNIAVLSKLESKLPSQIKHNWIQKVVIEKLSKETSKEKYSQFQLFLKEAK